MPTNVSQGTHIHVAAPRPATAEPVGTPAQAVPEPSVAVSDQERIDVDDVLTLDKEAMLKLYCHITKNSDVKIRRHDDEIAKNYIDLLRDAPSLEGEYEVAYQMFVSSFVRAYEYEGQEFSSQFEGWFIQMLFGGNFFQDEARAAVISDAWMRVLTNVGCQLEAAETVAIGKVLQETIRIVNEERQDSFRLREVAPEKLEVGRLLSFAVAEFNLNSMFLYFHEGLHRSLAHNNFRVLDDFLKSLGLDRI